MEFRFHCPTCDGEVETDATLSGSEAPCPHCSARLVIPEARIDSGTILAGFRLEQRLGQGGMGEVFLATQLSVNREVAVKVLPPGFASRPGAVQRFLQEGRLAARLDHANIVTVHEAGEDCGYFYLAMAYIDGESLDVRLRREGRMAEPEALRICRAIAEALDYAWDEFQLLHRDLKPANIMVDRRDRVFLTDMGIAKSLVQDSAMTLTGSIMGTPHYMSPEQAAGARDIGFQADMYSLGATLYHLTTGTRPFEAATMMETLSMHINSPLPPPRMRNPELSEGCAALIGRMMAKKPAARYSNWAAVIEQIDRIAAPGRSGTDMAQTGRSPKSVRLAARTRTRRTAALAAAAAAVLIAMAAATFHLATRHSRKTAAAAHPPEKQHREELQSQAPKDTEAAKTPATPPTLFLAEPDAPAPDNHPANPAAETPQTPSNAPAPPAVTTPGQDKPPAVAVPRESDSHDAAPVQVAALSPRTERSPDLSGLTAAILAGNPDDALRLWREKADSLGAELQPDQRSQIDSHLKTLTDIDQTILESLKADLGKTIQLQLARETIPCKIAEVTTDGLQVEQSVRHGRGTGTLRRHVRVRDLSVAEKVRRLGSGDSAQQNLQRAMLALTVGRLETAARLFEKAEGPLADALVAEIEIQQVRARTAAARRACDELMRQISAAAPTTTRGRDETIAAIRERCGGKPAKVHEGRKLLAEFEEQWGDIDAARDVAATVREALAACFPWPEEPWTVPTIAADMVPVPAGHFQMGSDAGRPNSRPVHTVKISRHFWLGKTEVTQRQYETLIHRNPAAFRGQDRPVEQVNWEDAMAFCHLLSERENAAGRIPDGYEYRLPTEAEWEYAAHGALETPATLYAGSDRVEEVAWFAQTAGETTHDVAGLKPNRLGLYDMSGNVWEWCLDWGSNEYYSQSPDTDPVCTQPSVNRSMRGGAWNSVVWGTETSGRDGQGPMLAKNTVGFRICLAPHLDLP